MPQINPLLLDTATPPIPEAQGWGRSYQGAAGPLIDLSQAVPGYPPHPEMLERIARAAGQPATAGYGPILGDSSLREAYAAHVSGLYGAAVAEHEVAVTTGCNQAFFVAMLALAKTGESVLLPSPWYFNHKMALDMLGIEARALPCAAEAGFVPDVDDAERLVDAGTRAIVLVSPNNPTGAIYPPSTIAAFSQLCARRNLFLVLDETDRDFVEGRPHEAFAEEGWRERTIGLYSFSKAYCIPGHRLGIFMAGEPIMVEIAKVLDTLQICAPRAAQAAVAWALDALAGWRLGNRREIDARADAFREAFAGLNDWRIDSVGSYFAFLRHPFAGQPAAAVVKALVEARGVLCLPGPYFGAGQESHLRAAFANVGAAELRQLRERLAGLDLS
jgi:aspartate/methionine/tyrosine aminotransferase